ncbi:hypothetical protein V2G26_008464 [Clonostachys chloroleuca]
MSRDADERIASNRRCFSNSDRAGCSMSGWPILSGFPRRLDHYVMAQLGYIRLAHAPPNTHPTQQAS